MFLLLTTSIIDDVSIVNLERLNSSLLKQEYPIYHVILTQNPKRIRIPEFQENSNYIKELISYDKKISLSSARNIMLKHCEDNGIFEKVSYVAFPDDDCWYTDGLLSRIAGSLQNCSFVFSRYSSLPKIIEPHAPREANVRDVVRQASSNTIFFTTALAKTVGYFDERLGVGAKFNGGEDLDYALRALIVNESAHFFDIDCIGHRDKVVSLKAKYFQGSYIALGKQKFKSIGIFIQFMRKLIVGIYLVIFSTLSYRKLLIVK